VFVDRAHATLARTDKVSGHHPTRRTGDVVNDSVSVFLRVTLPSGAAPLSESMRRRLPLDRARCRLAMTASRVLGALVDGLSGHGDLRWAGSWDHFSDPTRKDKPIAVLTRLNRNLAAACKHPGPLALLDATADVQALEAILRRQVQVLELDVRDAVPVERVIVATMSSTRAALVPRGKVRWDALTGPLSLAFSVASARDTKHLLLISYKGVIDRLMSAQVPPPLRDWFDYFAMEGRRIVTAHYGHVRGQNSFREVHWSMLNCVISVGDPWPHIGAVQAECRLLELEGASEARVLRAARAELAQAHGRIRACRRTRPALLVHVGGLIPTGWHIGNASVIAAAPGPSPNPSFMSVPELRQVVDILGARGLARAVGDRSEGSIRAYLRGRAIPRGVAEQIRSALRAVGSDLTARNPCARREDRPLPR
jgi:hypothetical protein